MDQPCFNLRGQIPSGSNFGGTYDAVMTWNEYILHGTQSREKKIFYCMGEW